MNLSVSKRASKINFLKRLSTTFTVVALSSLLSVSHAYTCKSDTINASISPGQFVVRDDGTVTDVRNGLMWMACSIGQTYNPSSHDCEGEATNYLDWKDALIAANEYYTGQADDNWIGWRLPNIKELGSIVERQCTSPAIDLLIFPSTPSAVYWTNTPDNMVSDAVDARVIDFTDGSEFVTEVNQHRHVRLVKSLN